MTFLVAVFGEVAFVFLCLARKLLLSFLPLIALPPHLCPLVVGLSLPAAEDELPLFHKWKKRNCAFMAEKL